MTAVAGVGHSPVDRRWDGVSMDKTLGAYSILACQKAMDEAGVTPDQIDGVLTDDLCTTRKYSRATRQA
jgi:3-oxoacyl-[acyl-carrier-protein] synthase III